MRLLRCKTQLPFPSFPLFVWIPFTAVDLIFSAFLCGVSPLFLY